MKLSNIFSLGTLLLIGFTLVSCSKISSEIIPDNATHLLTNGEDKKWFKAEDRFIETDISIPASDCMMDDLDVFVVNGTSFKEYGNNKCNGSDPVFLNGSWKFYEGEKFLIRNYTLNGISISDTSEILQLNENILITKKSGQYLIKSIYYPR